MIGVIFRKVRFIKFDKKISNAQSIRELDRWYHNQIKLAIEHGKIDYISSRHLKAYYEKQRRKLATGKEEKRKGKNRIKKALLFSKNDFFELLDMDVDDNVVEFGVEKTEEDNEKEAGMITVDDERASLDEHSHDERKIVKKVRLKHQANPHSILPSLPSQEIPLKLPEAPRE